MPKQRNTTARFTAIVSYLEEEFPGHVEEAEEHVFIISVHGLRHHVVLEATFLQQCPDYTRAIRETELADYMREARSQARCFLVMWHEHDTRIRSAPLWLGG